MLTPEALPLELFKYELPDSLIAHYPVDPPDSCRLLVTPRDEAGTEHRVFNQLPELLREGDLLRRRHPLDRGWRVQNLRLRCGQRLLGERFRVEHLIKWWYRGRAPRRHGACAGSERRAAEQLPA